MIIVNYNEIALKGKNRNIFENKLVFNIADCLRKNNVRYKQIRKVWGRILIETDSECPELENVFGISSISCATECSASLADIRQNSESFIKKLKGSFCVDSRVIESKTKLTKSMINNELGEYIRTESNAAVDLTRPDNTLFVEIIGDKAYLFEHKIAGPGGLPVGSEGTVFVELKDRKSLLAAVLMMKRGCKIILEISKKIDYSKLKRFEYGFKLKAVKNKDCNIALVTGATLDDYETNSGLMPLIGLRNEDILQQYERHGL
jgi:thiamine biosynthesis protein ThiI